jgi:antitoxin VapB
MNWIDMTLTRSKPGESMKSRKATLFRNNKSQAVRIPRDFEFKGVSEVLIHQEGNVLVISPARKSWTSYAAVEKADDDFLIQRSALLEEGRVEF